MFLIRSILLCPLGLLGYQPFQNDHTKMFRQNASGDAFLECVALNQTSGLTGNTQYYIDVVDKEMAILGWGDSVAGRAQHFENRLSLTRFG